jgi:hypothetical protein
MTGNSQGNSDCCNALQELQRGKVTALAMVYDVRQSDLSWWSWLVKWILAVAL